MTWSCRCKPGSPESTESVVISLLAVSFFVLSPASWHLDIMLISAAMAFNAVLEVPNTLFDVLAPDLLGRVLMAAVTGIAAVVVTYVTRGASHVVITIQNEVLVVIEGRRHPFLLGMALTAIPSDLLMERIGG